MNSRTIRIICTAAISAMLTACVYEHEVEAEPVDGAPIVVRGNIGQQYTTRADDGGFADGDEIGVFVVTYSQGLPQPLRPDGNHADNVCFKYNATQGKWNGQQSIYWPDGQTHVDAYGYYPYDDKLARTDAYSFQINPHQQETATYEASDFLWAKATDVTPGTPIDLKHQHLMAGIEVTLVEGEDFDEGEWDLLEKSVIVENTIMNTVIDLQTGTVMPVDEDTQPITALRQGKGWRAIVAPQQVDAGKSVLTIIVGSESYRLIKSEPMTYHAGRLHKFTVKVDKKPQGDYIYTLLTEAITPWEADALSHQGDTKAYVVVDIAEGQFLGDVITAMGLDPELIVNLKLTGIMTSASNENAADSNFGYLRSHFTNLEAINMQDLRLKGGSVDKYHDDIIPDGAFQGMTMLQSVIFPSVLKAIGSEAFQQTSLRMSCLLPEGLEYVGYSAFGADDYYSGNLEKYDAKNSIRPHMTGELYIPSSCTYIGDYAFAGQDFTSELILPQRMRYLGSDAFRNCKYMTGYLHIPEGLEVVNSAWRGMKQLTGFAEVPEGVRRVRTIGCPISSLHLPEGVEQLEHVFDYYLLHGGEGRPKEYEDYRKELKEVFLPSTLRALGDGMYDGQTFAGTGISHISLPDAIEIIPDECFDWCENLQDTVRLPQSCYRIGARAFRHCAMMDAVVLPEGLTEIMDGAFSACYSLSYIECHAMEPPRLDAGHGFERDDPFYGVQKSTIALVVPEGAVDAYRNAPGWSEFKHISAYRNFVCRPMQDKLLNRGHVMDVVLNADGDWTVTHQPQWAHVDQTSGYKKTALKVTVDDLPHGAADRQDSIVFTLAGQKDEMGKPITCYYKLSQYDYEYDEDQELALQRATRGNGRISIFLCGDGYDAKDIADGTYLSDMQRTAEYFFGVEPYTTYKDYFTVYTGFALSRESGINTTNRWRDTKFESYFGNACIDVRLSADFDGAMAYALQTSPNLTAGNPPLVILLANTSHYDGVTSLYTDNAAVAVCTKSDSRYPYDARGIVQHEAGGHGFGKLADEYIYHRNYIQTCGCICCEHVSGLLAMKSLGWARNLSLEGKYSNSEWRQLIFDPRYSDICDIYEGGYFHQRGVFRPEVNSCMNNNIPYFSTVSRMAIVERIKQYAGETFSYEDFVAHDNRAMGDRFATRGSSASGNTSPGGGRHLLAPIIRNVRSSDLLRTRKKSKGV